MKKVLITGIGGLIGSEAATYYIEKGWKVVGVENNMRSYFFGSGGSTALRQREIAAMGANIINIDIRDIQAIENIFKATTFSAIIHTAAQPSHDWAQKEPLTDFSINAHGTLNILESARKYAKDAPFIFTSTNKVYGDRPNDLPLIESESRFELTYSHEYYQGINETMSIDNTTHSLFGASKVAADILVQEYGRYFGMPTVCFRGGCLTGPNHSGVELHGFLSYLVYCFKTQTPYNIIGYKGKQVRDNIHASDLISAFWCFSQKPSIASVYNIGGSRYSHSSVLECIERIALHLPKPQINITTENRIGDHMWWVTDTRKFKTAYPEWEQQYNMERIIKEMCVQK